jgi:hypothetical protein
MPKSPETGRQAYALAHPLNRTDGDIAPYRSVRKHGPCAHLRAGRGCYLAGGCFRGGVETYRRR